MTTLATKTRRANLAAFNAAFAAGTTKSVCAVRYPHIGGERAVFYKNTNSKGGWLVATTGTAASTWDVAIEVSDAIVARADAVEYDPYNDAAYSQALIAISNAVRGIETQGDDDHNESDYE